MKDYLKEAKAFRDKAIKEFKKECQENDALAIRDACEKGWNAIVQATNALFKKQRVCPLPRTYKDKRDTLERIEKENGKLREKAFLDRFMARCHRLHVEGFYEGEVSLKSIEYELSKVSEFIRDVEEF